MYFSSLIRSSSTSRNIILVADSVKNLPFFPIKIHSFSTATRIKRVDDQLFSNQHPHSTIEAFSETPKGGNFSDDVGYHAHGNTSSSNSSSSSGSSNINDSVGAGAGAGISRRGYHHHSAPTLIEKTPPLPILWWNRNKNFPSKQKAGCFESVTGGEQEQFKSNTIYPNQFQQVPTTVANLESVSNKTTSEHLQYIAELDDFSNLYKGRGRNTNIYKVKKAVQALDKLEKLGVHVDLPRYFRLMQACGHLGEVEYAEKVHHHLITSTTKNTTPMQIEVDTFNQILDMYSECGSMSDAWEVFDSMPQRNLMSWDTMIAGFAKNGLGEDALDLFDQFKEAGLKPSGQMFMGVFLACSVLCDIDEGMLQFESMSKVYGIVPSMEHYVSVVNMLGSPGYLDEAMEFIEKMPFKPSIVWETLLNLCRAHGNYKLGDHCSEMIKYLDPSCLADESVKAFSIDKKKCDYLTFYELGSITECPQKLVDFLRRMISQRKEIGYVLPKNVFSRDALLPIEEEDREESIFFHKEKFDVALTLLHTSPRTTIVVTVTPSRICEDCHDAMKFISKLAGRLIIIKNYFGLPDNPWYHQFRNGVCSCKDSW